MTNSISSAKCPSILTSGKYGMSQRRSVIDDSKEYIFVKLTDSAFRAIEEYQRNAQSKRLQKGQCAKIQFIGNAGVIQFPPSADVSTSSSGPSDGRKFGFAIDDVEGSLECVQQSGTDLDVLGSLNYRMRIHANDDVYDTTRTKMAIAEETEKSKCIREIKPNQTDIGRKVKRPISAASIQVYNNGATISSLLNGLPNSNGISGSNCNSSSNNGSTSYVSSGNNNHNSSNNSNSNSRNKLATSLNQHSPPSGGSGAIGNGSVVGVNGPRLLSNASSLRSSPNPSLIGGCGTISGGNNRYGSPLNSSASSSSLPSMSLNNINGGGSYSPPGSGTNHISNSLSPHQKKTNIGNGVNGRGNGAVIGKGSLNSNGKANGISNGKNFDVSRRKIRERLIHLLALKPFKKPELYSRLQNEGLAQRERQLISTILKDISTLARDNTYNLRRSMWNDVDENWPFFSEQEIQQLKRRKPQNLTPPTSSDAGSSISGHSPTSSTHTGSPPPLVSSSTMNGRGVGAKRTSLEPDFYDGIPPMGTQSKKQRISHYKKDSTSNGTTLINSSNLGSSSRTCLGVGNNNGSSSYQNHKASSASYSPHTYNTGNSNVNDENSGNSDLTFNVLSNMDDFIQHTAVGGDSNFVGRNKTTTTGNSKSCGSTSSSSSNNTNNISSSSTTKYTTAKEKRNSGGSSSSSGYGSNRESSTSIMRRKNSPTPYANNFVPENKISSNSNGTNMGCKLNKQQQAQRRQQQLSPSYSNQNYRSSHKLVNNTNSSNSVVPNIHDDCLPTLAQPTSQTITPNHNTTSSSGLSRHHSNPSGLTGDRGSSDSSVLGKHSRSSTPTQKNFHKYNSNVNNNHSLILGNMSQEQQTINNIQEQGEQQTMCFDVTTSPQTASHSTQQSQQQEHSSPTQQIAAAASTFSLTNHSTPLGDAPRYDFSSYTPITSIEQRRKYKTEFESDYDEYRKLLAQIESVGHRFRELAARLSSVQQGCIDYYNIKDQIVSEYNRIRKEEAINRDKQRFDYLHEKLAHIKQLVMDYDKKLTSGLATPTTGSNSQQLQHESLNQEQQMIIGSNSAHLSPMLQSSGESNHSPPLMNPTSASVAIINNNLASSSRRGSKHQKYQHQQEQHYKHHEPETIHMMDDNAEGSEENTSLQYRQHLYNNFNTSDMNQQQHKTCSEILEYSDNHKQQKYESQQQHQAPSQVENHNNDSDSDSDSTSSTSSNDDDNSDDDNSDASEDENSDDDSNDEDNDDQ